jgi:hypothetical protein
MPSFEIAYDGEEDVLEAVFASYDERFARTITLNDHIFLHTDLGMGAVWAITMYSYARLLGVNETEFTSLREMTDAQAAQVFALLTTPPASLFLEVTDTDRLLARVRAPSLQPLLDVGEEE